MTADKVQIAGTHYVDLEIQPWEVIEKNGLGFFDGNALKYIMRYKSKGGVEDLRKAKHYIEKLIEMETAITAKCDGKEHLVESVFAKNKEFKLK